MKRLLLLTFIALVGCGEEKMIYVYTADFITKETEIAYPWRMENTPFMWNGEMHMMISARPDLGDPSVEHAIEIYDKDKNLISKTPTNYWFGSAYAEGGTLYFFGTLERTRIYMMTTTDLVNWSAPTLVRDYISGWRLYNTSVTKVSTGGYAMAYETCEKGTECFNIRFMRSNDLVNWTDVPGRFSGREYAACPTIREIDGTFYMMYLKDFHGHWATVIAKSSNLGTWYNSPTVALSALNTEGETINNSDADIIEVGGKTIITYGIGNQASFSHIKFAHYDGTNKQFFEEFFK